MSPTSLSGKVALVTGGTSGIGKAAVLALAAAGTNVVLTGRRREEGEQAATEARRHGVRALFVQGDVTDEKHVREAVDAAAGINGRLDFAFNNAGIELTGVPVAETTAEQYRRVFDVNVLGVLLSMKHEMRAMNGKGSIVNNGSIAGRVGFANTGVYIASKHAVLGLTRTAAMEGAKLGIRVNSVSPGGIETERFDRFTGGGNPDAVGMMTSLHPIGRLGRPEEIARPVLFLFSDDASFITGHDLLVDGGFTVP